MPQTVAGSAEYRRALASRSVVVTHFRADKVLACATLSNQLEVYERQFSQVLFLQVDVDAAEELAAACKVQGVPTVTFHVDTLRLEPSTVRGLHADRIYHTLTNLTRGYEEPSQT